LTQTDVIFQRGKNEKFGIFGENFPDSDPTRPEQQKNDPTQVKKL